MAKLPREPAPPILNPVLPDFFRLEANRETSKNEGLADDNTTITLLHIDSLRRMKQILQEFSVASGLICNYEKSVIMPIKQPNADLQAQILDLGFSLTNSFKLLGLNINSSLDNIRDTFMESVEKITSLVNFWSRFKLTLPGRLTIMKTCLISQLNYIGCFLPMPEDITELLQQIINSFVKKNLQVSAERLYLDPEQGGLGIFDLKIFFQAQHCSWIKRANAFRIDNWRFDLANLAPSNNILLLRPSDVNPLINPILHNLVLSYTNFYGRYSRLNGNYKEAYIFENSAFALNDQQINAEFFGQNFYNLYKNNIISLTFSMCFMGPRMKTCQEFADAGLPFTPATWMRLQATLLHSRHQLKKQDDSDNLSGNIANFFNLTTKGSKQFRKILQGGALNRPVLENMRIVTNYSMLVSVPTPEPHLLGKCMGLWNKSYLPNDLRNFLFLLRNNSLPLNNRLHAFDANVSPLCSFCRIVDRDTVTRDSFNHFFLTCPVTNNLLRQWTSDLIPAPDINSLEFRKLYWYGSGSLTDDVSGTAALVMDIFKYAIWKSKQRRRLPNAATIKREVSFILEAASALSRKLRQKILNITLISNLLQARG